MSETISLANCQTGISVKSLYAILKYFPSVRLNLILNLNLNLLERKTTMLLKPMQKKKTAKERFFSSKNILIKTPFSPRPSASGLHQWVTVHVLIVFV